MDALTRPGDGRPNCPNRSGRLAICILQENRKNLRLLASDGRIPDDHTLPWPCLLACCSSFLLQLTSWGLGRALRRSSWKGVGKWSHLLQPGGLASRTSCALTPSAHEATCPYHSMPAAALLIAFRRWHSVQCAHNVSCRWTSQSDLTLRLVP